MRGTLALLCLPLVLSSALDNNLSYRSPYSNKPRFALNTTHISGRHYRAAARYLAKRQGTDYDGDDFGGFSEATSVPKPEGESRTYSFVGYGPGVAVWDNSDYIYSGSLNFTHGIASGDPYDYSVILWTRAKPTQNWAIDVPVCVEYKVWSKLNATGKVVSSGWALTGADVDFTVKIEATGLTADHQYSYQFSNCAKPSEKSMIGKTRTTPGYYAKKVRTHRFSIFSCSSYRDGFFNSYSGPVRFQDSDYTIHLGDYIYEDGGAGHSGRNHSRNSECSTLGDYRARYAQYRQDPDLVAMHQELPLIAIWDDHETADQTWKAGSADSSGSPYGCDYSSGYPNGTTCWTDRRLHAIRAYHEWIPIRSVDASDELRIWRQFRFGNLLDMFALDTRYGDRDVTDMYGNTDYVESLAVQMNSSRSIMGRKQEKWFLDGLDESHRKDHGRRWKMVLNQVIFGTIDYSLGDKTPPAPGQAYLNYDAWDGYQAQRGRVVKHIHDNDIDNVVVYTGDMHSSWVLEVNPDTIARGQSDPGQLKQVQTTTNSRQKGQVVEFVGTSVTSLSQWGAGYANYSAASDAAKRDLPRNPAVLYAEGKLQGYMHVAVNYTHLVTTYYVYFNNSQQHRPENRTTAIQFVNENGYNQVQRPLQQPAYACGAVKPGNF